MQCKRLQSILHLCNYCSENSKKQLKHFRIVLKNNLFFITISIKIFSIKILSKVFFKLESNNLTKQALYFLKNLDHRKAEEKRKTRMEIKEC